MKKTYITPEVYTITLVQRQNLLAGSPQGTGMFSTTAGSEDGDLSREGDLDDDF